MGGCNCKQPGNAEEQASNQKITIDLILAERLAIRTHKLLLLGPGNSGKSTFLKQLTQLHGDGFQEKEKLNALPYIHDSILNQVEALIKFARDQRKAELQPNTSESARIIMELPRSDIRLDKEIGHHVKIIWDDPEIKLAFKERESLAIADSIPHFLTDIDRISSDDYLPTEEDLILSRIPTTGIKQTAFEIQGKKFLVVDVGGQRSERSKWIHCFTDVTAILFVAALSCYDQYLFEENGKNALEEALDLWEECTNSFYFSNGKTSMILFLNKVDIFEDKIQKKSLKVCFPEFDGPDGDADSAIKFIGEEFIARVEKKEDKKIFTHVTCATDEGNVARVFSDVQITIVSSAMNDADLL